MAVVQTKPTVPLIETIEEKFHRLANAWHLAVAHQSSSSKRENHPAYHEIIALGPPVVPFLLRDLELTHRHWFTALTIITGANPVPECDAGQISEMTESWLNWGKSKGYRW